MQTKVVIDAIVQQTTVLIAQLATSAGMRAPLAHIASQTFMSLTRELERQGVAQKVVADMFGLALRSYQQKVQRLSESETDRGRSLWEAIHTFLSQRAVVSRSQILQRFARDDEPTVRGILSDMVDTGVAFKSGRGDATVYRVLAADEAAEAGRAHSRAAVAALVWLSIYRQGPLTSATIAEALHLSDDAVFIAIEQLLGEGRIQIDRPPPDAGGDQHRPEAPRYRADYCLVPLGTSAGWEAALVDHYQALVRSMCAKLQMAAGTARPDDRIGGSTYSFDVWPGHPLAARVEGLLAAHRAQVSELWDEVAAHNDAASAPDSRTRVTFYFGQVVTDEDHRTQPSEET